MTIIQWEGGGDDLHLLAGEKSALLNRRDAYRSKETDRHAIRPVKRDFARG
jgi:hypothetical protein